MVDDHGSQLFRFRPRNENWRTQLKGQIQEIPIADDVLEIKVKHSLEQIASILLIFEAHNQFTEGL